MLTGERAPPASSKRRSTPTLASAGTSPCPCCNAKEDAAAQATPLRGRESAPDAGGGTATGQRQRRAALPPPEDSASASSAASRAKVFHPVNKEGNAIEGTLALAPEAAPAAALAEAPLSPDGNAGWGPPELRQVPEHLPRGPLLCPFCPPAGPLGIPPQRNHRLGYAFESEFA